MKTKQQIQNEVSKYLSKTSQHLFTTAQGYLYKIETFERDGKLYYATILMGKGNVMITVKEAMSDRQFADAGNNSLNLLQQGIFPTYFKTQSIPYFKKMREMIKYLMGEIKVDEESNKELITKLKAKLPELEPTK